LPIAPVVAVLTDLIRERGPLTVAAFMDAALYHPEAGYYARAAQRSGRAGDFFTNVDVGPLFGTLLARQIAEMAHCLDGSPDAPFDLVEAGAGNGRLSRDILSGLSDEAPDVLARTRLHLVEASPTARLSARDTLGSFVAHLTTASIDLPETFEGVLLANELLDAMPVHQVVMHEDGLREMYVDHSDGRLVLCEGSPSTPRLARYFSDLGIDLEPGWRAEVSLAAIDWIRHAIGNMTRGFALLVDYGHPAAELYSATHSTGTLTSYMRHTSPGPEPSAASPPWLTSPGEQDLTAHVDFTSVIRAGQAAGAVTLGFMDQTYLLMALAADRLSMFSVRDRLALKTLLMPGGLGSTMKVLMLGKNVGAPALLGCSGRNRVT
jgi:SAM-dependent MidA family methyltransferase